MAKGKHKKKKHEATGSAPTVADRPPKSLVGQAWAAYEAGDVVTARRAASAAVAREALTATDEADARDIAKVLLPGVEADARKVAAEILERTRVERKAWVFVALAAVLVVLMIVIAVARA